MNLFLDLETIPTGRQDVRDYIEESMRDELQSALDTVCAPANYKDAEKIAQFWLDKRALLQSEFSAKLADKIKATGLDGSFGQVFCIGWACDEDEPTTAYGTNERFVLEEFKRLLHVEHLHSSCVIGHNVSAFDLRFLTQRYIVNGIKPPLVIARSARAKPWEDEKVFDTMVQWAGVGQRVSLDKLCLALSVTSPKGELDGSKVWEFVQAGRHDEIARYCERDVAAAREVWRRMTFSAVPVPQFDDVPA